MRMQKMKFGNEWAKWVDSAGGISKAALKIAEKLECSTSKAEKLAARRYPSHLTASEEIALADLIGKPREVIFKVGRAQAS